MNMYRAAKDYIVKPLAGLALIVGVGGCQFFEGKEVKQNVPVEYTRDDTLKEYINELKLEQKELEGEIGLEKEKKKSGEKILLEGYALLEDIPKRQAKVLEKREEQDRLHSCIGEILNAVSSPNLNYISTRENPGSVESGCLYALEFDNSGDLTIYIKPTKDKNFIESDTFFEMMEEEDEKIDKEIDGIIRDTDEMIELLTPISEGRE